MKGVYRISNEICQNILEAAILDFNIIQAQHQIEFKIISKWWTEASEMQKIRLICDKMRLVKWLHNGHMMNSVRSI